MLAEVDIDGIRSFATNIQSCSDEKKQKKTKAASHGGEKMSCYLQSNLQVNSV